MLETTHINPALTELGDKFTQCEPDSITIEEGDLLYVLARMRKPMLAIETGTGHAVSTKRIGEALRDNKRGYLLSCDTDPDYVGEARTKTASLPVDVRCSVGMVTLSSFGPTQQSEFIFIDAGNVLNRLQEIQFIVSKDLMAPKGLLIVHDAINKAYCQLPEYLKKQGWAGLVFESLAGIAVFQHP